MGLWAKSLIIFNSIREYGKQSIRRLAEQTGFSKSSVHRHLQAMNRRDRYPESSLWEAEAGRNWLIRLVVATLCVFGLKRGVGAETISEFFGHLHLEAHVGCSPSALRSIMHTLERLIMDLASGYVLLEEVAVDRSYDTWYDLATARLKTLGTGVLYLVSDRAKALIKLAHTGLGCLSIPDLFHLSHDLAKGYALAMCSRLRHAQQALARARQRLEALQASQADRAQVEQAQASVEDSETSVKHWQGVCSAYRESLANLSRIMHPWRLVDSTRQTSQAVEHQWQAELQALETLLE